MFSRFNCIENYGYHHGLSGVGERGTTRKSGDVRSASRNLNLFMTKIRDFPYLINDLIHHLPPEDCFVFTDRALCFKGVFFDPHVPLQLIRYKCRYNDCFNRRFR